MDNFIKPKPLFRSYIFSLIILLCFFSKSSISGSVLPANQLSLKFINHFSVHFDEFEHSNNSDSISWWRVLENSYNDELTITRSKTKSSNTYDPLIAEIQRYMGNKVGITGYNGLYNGEWDDLTSKCIMNWKKRFDYNWEGGNSGDVICKSFYKTIVYLSKDRVTLLDRCIQDVTQRPGILQEAWNKIDDDKWINEWANNYAKNWIDNMADFSKLCEIDWSDVNSFEGYKELGIDEDFLNKICPSDLPIIYVKMFNKQPEGGKKLDQNYKMLLEVLNYIKLRDFEVIKKDFKINFKISYDE